MPISRLSATFRAGGAVLLLLVLQGCAVVTAPGFDYADPKSRTSITLGQYVPGDANNPPQGVVTPITPALVQAQVQARPKEVSADVRRLFGAPKPYTIGPSDIIGVIVYDHPELLPNAGAVISQQADPTGITSAPGFIVGADGQISFPFIGRVKVAGLTENEATDQIRGRLAKYIKDPQVTVRITSFRSRRAYVDGEVKNPGAQIFTDVPMTLPEAINRAGGITPAGDRSSVTLTRGNQTTPIDLLQLQDLGFNANDIILESGDLVTVRSREDSKVFVMGEVTKQSAVVMRNGRLTLNEALGEVGGANLTTANTRQIYVIRNTAQGNSPAVFHLDAASPTALALAETFALRPRDVVYIDPVPLVNWNRIVSLILPSASALNQGASALR
ncbi:polysaccharide biosynthesis/export family protein [Ramlibacter algicola]|uniref:Polysaccharide biosynthesis/export family protein n=1 Tax=Ramlibacter algicola TaxID=2795217 RepID=A0A934Q0C9_9BURK|nr:polysaccharide biosynthesis/export family protein [Ramlibacter algicola]MBK0391979.1 polysaccharide biosynthesis/export family protein [Ramlibacter algicola]